MSVVTQDLRAKVEFFLIAAMERSNKIGRTYISGKALSVDMSEDISGG